MRIRKLKLCCVVVAALCLVPLAADAAQVKICIFNFAARDMESAGFGTTLSQNLNEFFRSQSDFTVMDRKELEQFLSLNDLQQNDRLDNIVNIGSRLGLDIVVTGSIGRSGQVTIISAKAVQINQKKIIASTDTRALGESGIASETKNIANKLAEAIRSCDLAPKSDAEFAVPPPVNLRARPASQSVTLVWDCAPGASGFKIYRALSEAGPYTGIATVRSVEYTDQELEKNKKYFYKVRSYNDKGLQSDYSKVVRCETEAVPNPPIIIKSEPMIKGVHMTFSANPSRSEDSQKITGFKMYRSAAEDGPYKELEKISSGELLAADDQSAVKLQYFDSGLKDGQTVFYRLTAINEKGLESEYSRAAEAAALPAVSGLEIRGDMIREIFLGWARLNSPSVAGYNIYRGTSEKGEYVKIKSVEPGPENKSMNIVDTTGLADLTKYFYKVTAFDLKGAETAFSAIVSATTRGKPPVPRGLTAQGGQVKQVTLNWKPADQDEVQGYRIYRSTEKAGKLSLVKKIEGGNKETFTDEGKGPEYDFSFAKKLEDGKTYYYCITSYNKVDVESAYSPVVSASTKPRPSAPRGLKPDNRDGKPGLAWAPNPEQDIVLYIVHEKTDSGLKKLTETKETEYQEKSPPRDRNRVVAITAVDKDGLESEPSAAFTLKD